MKIKKTNVIKDSGKKTADATMLTESSGNKVNKKNKKRKFVELENPMTSTGNKHVEKKIKRNDFVSTEVVHENVKKRNENFRKGKKSTENEFKSDKFNVFNVENSKTQEKQNSEKKTSRNKFACPTTNAEQKISENKLNKERKKRQKHKHKKTVQMPNSSSLTEPRFSPKSMLQKPKEDSQNESKNKSLRKQRRNRQKTSESSMEISSSLKSNGMLQSLSHNEDDSDERRNKVVNVIHSEHVAQKKLRGFFNREETVEREKRTIFVGNLPLNVDQKALKKIFASCGVVECARIRASVPAKSTISRRIANITQEYHRNIKSLKGYVVFKSVDDIEKALAMNGTLLQDHHLRVDAANGNKTHNDKKSVFVGNLPFNVEEEALWSVFSECGEVEGVRIVRDHDTGVGKGFGFVLFKSSKSVEQAINMNETEVEGRQIRVKSIDSNSKQQKGKFESLSKQKFNNFKYKAVRHQRTQKSSGRKSIKKLMKKERINQQKKRIASMFQQQKKLSVATSIKY